MIRKRYYLFLAALMVIIFLLVATAIALPEVRYFDTWILVRLMAYRSHLATIFFKVITFFGTSIFFYLATAALGISFLLGRDYRGFWVLMFTMNGAWALMEGLKAFYHRPRPTLGPLEPAPGFSFPSGHAMMGTVFFSLLALVLLQRLPSRYHPLVARLTIFFLFLLGLSRLYLGVHYPTDVLAGYAAGLAVVSLYRLWWPR
ncbi:Phosphatidylglycerophosphatase B [Moorella thermoacetica]